MQAYVEYLHEVIKKHEEAALLKDQLIRALEERSRMQSDHIGDLQASLNRILALLGVTPDVVAETKALVDP